MRIAIFFAAVAALCSAGLLAEEAEPLELYDDLIHSDVPLWGKDHSELWPQGFSSGEGENFEFGCTSRVAFGDWKITYADKETQWVRLSNYGVFHCAAVERFASEQKELGDAEFKYSFFAKIGETRSHGKKLELWVLQSGFRPGSIYTLLAREPSEGLIKSFIVLQRQCPAGMTRKGPPMDVWRTEYCGISSRQDMIRFAIRMSKRPPLGLLERVEPGPSAAVSD